MTRQLSLKGGMCDGLVSDIPGGICPTEKYPVHANDV